MTEGSLHHLSLRGAAGATRPAKKQILRAHMAALARRIYGPDQAGNYHRGLAANLLQTRRRAAGR
jgi:ABC-type Fe3+ transport system substrate-binding protein